MLQQVENDDLKRHAQFMAKVYATVGHDITPEQELGYVNALRKTVSGRPLTLAEYQAIQAKRQQEGKKPAPSIFSRLQIASKQW